jgi:hypothetical protein
VLFNKITISGWPKTNTDPQQPIAVGMTGDDVRGKKPNSQRQMAAVHHRASRHGCLPCATGTFPSRAVSL